MLSTIKHPLDIKDLSIEQLYLLCDEMRSHIIKIMNKNGGHLGSNLGSIEFITALHKVFSSPIDQFIFDTSHQCYPHKLLTGRYSEFHTIRQFMGLSGFTTPLESPHDHFIAGHAGTALSLALGVAKGRDLSKKDHYVIAILNDASFSCGLTLEALNNVPKNLKNFIIIINDNDHFISSKQGSFSNNILPNTKEELAQFFSNFNLNYTEKVDGHNLKDLLSTLEIYKNSPNPIVIHIKTIKGKGLKEAENSIDKMHGVKPSFLSQKKQAATTFPKVFGKHIKEMAEKDDSICIVSPAMLAGSALENFKKQFPERCFDVGIAEGHSVTFAAALAKTQNVCLSIYSSFLQRALDNVYHDVCLQQIPLVFAIDRASMAGADGATHNGIYDLSFLLALPNSIIAQPRDGAVLKALFSMAFSWNKPTFIRYPNHTTTEKTIHISFGKGEILHHGKEIAIITLGNLHHLAFEIKDLLLESNINPTLVDPIFLSPLDINLLSDISKTHSLIITLEENSLHGGLGTLVNTHTQCKTLNFGIDTIVEHGSHKELIESVGLTAEKISEEILKSCSLKQEIPNLQRYICQESTF